MFSGKSDYRFTNVSRCMQFIMRSPGRVTSTILVIVKNYND